MASRQTAGTTSANQYAPGQASSQQQADINISSNPMVGTAASSAAAGPQNPIGSNALAAAIIGTTIAGSVVNGIEVWADGAVWDTTNNRYLIPYVHYDPTLRLRSGQ